MLGIKDKDTFPLIFLRENCADMAITEDDVEEALHRAAAARCSSPARISRPTYIDRISNLALERARRNDVRTVLDIDYRPVLWGLTKRGDGETRFIALRRASPRICSGSCRKFDLVIGTIEEFDIAGGSTDIIASLQGGARGDAGDARRQARADGLRGDRRRRFPRSLDDAFNGAGVDVEVLNVLGAGDAFSRGLPVRLGARRGLRRVRALRERLRRARRLASRLRAGDADARRARLLPRQRAIASRGRTRTRR